MLRVIVSNGDDRAAVHSTRGHGINLVRVAPQADSASDARVRALSGCHVTGAADAADELVHGGGGRGGITAAGIRLGCEFNGHLFASLV